jgi:glucosamine--fructose-6-phosphate aminotransferase (isomerizing)
MVHDMLAEIAAQRDLASSVARIGSEVEAVRSRLPDDVDRVHLFGSGDSYYAAEAVGPFLETAGRTQFRVHTAYQFTRYVAPHLGHGDVAVPISVSGNSVETVEGGNRAAEAGASVVGVTNAEDGRLSHETPASLHMGLDTRPGWVPETLTYLGLLATLYHLGIRLGVRSEDRAEACVEVLEATLRSVGSVIDAAESTARDVAANLAYTEPAPPFYVLGGGPSRATAHYVAAKFQELGLPRTHATGEESEEFAHGKYWTLAKTDPVFVLAPEGPGFERTLDVARGVREYGNDLVVVTDSDELAALGKYAFEVPVEDDLFSPLLYPVPLQLVVYHYTLELGLDADDGSHVDPHRKGVADVIHSDKRY